MGNAMNERRDYPRYGAWVRLIHYTEGNPLRGDQSAPDINVIGKVTETPHPGYGSNYLTIRPPEGVPFGVARSANGERFTIGPNSITLHAREAATEWTWEPTTEPTTRPAAPRVDIDALDLDSLDPRLVRAEIAMRLIRAAAANLAGTPYSGAFRLLEEAKAVLGPATNGINGAGVAYAVEYTERFLDTLTERTPR